MADILLKLTLADLESGDILNKGVGRRYNVLWKCDHPVCGSVPQGRNL